MFHMLLLSPYLKSIQTFSVRDVHKQGYPCQYIYGITAVMKAFGFLAPKDFKIILAFKYFVFEPT